MERLGLGYDDLAAVNPGLVYASITAFGQYGPYASQRGYDMLAQAISGYMSINGISRESRRRARASRSPTTTRACSARSASSRRSTIGTGRGRASTSTSRCSTACSSPSTTWASATRWAARCSRAPGNVSFGGSSSGVYPATRRPRRHRRRDERRDLAPLLSDHRPLRARRRSRVRDRGCAPRPPRRGRRGHRGMDERSAEERDREHDDRRRRSRGAGQQRRRDGGGSAGEGPRHVRRVRASRHTAR